MPGSSRPAGERRREAGDASRDAHGEPTAQPSRPADAAVADAARTDASAVGAAPVGGATVRAAPVDGATVEAWLADLGLTPGERAERAGIVAWDLALDGRRRRDLRATLILDPSLGAIVWAHLAPPIGDGLRKAYRTLLRWNEDFPLAKFSVAEDGRPILAVELPNRWLTADELGLALARVVGIADRVFDETRGWLWIGGRVPDEYATRPIRNEPLLGRFSGRLAELFEEASEGDLAVADAPRPGRAAQV